MNRTKSTAASIHASSHFVCAERLMDRVGSGLNVAHGPNVSVVNRSHHQNPFRVFAIQTERIGSQLKVASRFNSHGYLGRKIQICRTPFCQVHFAARQIAKTLANLKKISLLVTLAREQAMNLPSRWRSRIQRKAIVKISQTPKSGDHTGTVAQRKESIRFFSNESALDRRAKQRNENRCNGSNGRPSFPVNRTVLAELPTLADAIPHGPNLRKSSHVVVLSLSEPILP